MLFKKPPEKLVVNGDVTYGMFELPVSCINAMDYVLLDEMDREITGLEKRFKLHSFNYFGLVNENFIIGLAVYHLGYLGGYFIYVYSRNSGRITEFSSKTPFAAGVNFPIYTDRGTISFKGGRTAVVIEQDIENHRRIVSVKLKKLSLQFAMKDNYLEFKPLSLCTRNSYSGWTYTQKKADAPVVEGNLELEGEKYDLTGSRVIFDWTAGFLRRDTYWLWAAGTGKAGNHSLGFNFSNGVNETVFTENALWIDGNLVIVNNLEILYDRLNPENEWLIRSYDGKVDLVFRPEGSRSERLNLKLIKSNFTQFFGTFTGRVRVDDSIVEVEATGFTEKHFARW